MVFTLRTLSTKSLFHVVFNIKKKFVVLSATTQKLIKFKAVGQLTHTVLSIGLFQILSACVGIIIYRPKTKEASPRPAKAPGKQLKDRPPLQIVGHCGSCIIAPITSGSCSNLLRKWAQRATPPLLCHRVDESLLTYTAASPQANSRCPPMGCKIRPTNVQGNCTRQDKQLLQ
ncbi:hypothetical protein AVEN_128823-1 [Araneus ventricosus]|uniref:Uncharacterized protein n=1 Tax=Araneus ventricosus TaxID=182803 RepID=A0A4Y2K3M8_ARAVE|nr:hypothetical protein AVEN_128823-1 [Araneus ventricosus]